MEKQILMTSGFDFEGYSITEYLGVFSGESALGTGFLSSLGAGFADFFGSNSTMYSDKLRKAKDYAIEQLISQVEHVGGNAIIGLDIDYTTFSADIMGVIASGTAVRIGKKEITSFETNKVPIRVSNRNIPFKASALLTNATYDVFSAAIDIYSPEPYDLQGIMTDITFVTIFDENYVVKDVEFIDFSDDKAKHIMSSFTQLNMPNSIFRTIKSSNVIVKKYVIGNEVIALSGEDLECNSQDDMTQFSVDDFIYDIEAYDTAKDIVEYIQKYNSEHGDFFDYSLMEELDKTLYVERFYGNQKAGCIKEIRNYLESKN